MGYKYSFLLFFSYYVTINLGLHPMPKFQIHFKWKLKNMFLSKNNNSFLFVFPLMLLIWDFTRSQNFNNISYESWKRFYVKKKLQKQPKFFMFTTFFSQFDLQFDLKSSMLPKLRVVDPWRYFFVHTFAEKLNFHEINQKCQIFFYPFLMNLDLQSWSLAFYVTQTRHFKPLKHCFFIFMYRKS